MASNDVIEKPGLILKEAIQKILTENKSSINYSIMELYRYSFKMVIDKQSENLYNGMKDLVTEHLENNVRTMIENISSDSNMLNLFCNMWDDFQSSMDSINRILIYLDRVYIKSNPKIKNISMMSNRLFSILIIYYGRVIVIVRAQIFQMISEERDGKTVNREQIKKILTIMMSLESVLDEPIPVKETPTVYDIEFKPTVLNNFSSFFYEESKKLVKTSVNAMAYINSAESLIAREEIRIKYYFDEKTQIQLESIININLVQLHMDAIVEMKNNDIKFMIEKNEFENLTHMYNFLNRVDNGLEPMIKYLNLYVRELGKSIVRDINKNSTDVIQGLMDLNSTCNNLLVKCYYNDKRLKNTFTESFDYVVMSNPIVVKYLSVFVTDKFKKMLCSVETTSQEKVILEAMKIYDSLHEKDFFEYSCKQFIAMVLLNRYFKCSSLNNTELRLFSILKANCSHQFKSRMEDMIKDIDIHSKTIMDEFKQHVQSKTHCLKSVDHFNALLLTKAYWPTFKDIKCNLPLELSTLYNNFNQFYNNKYNKQLTLLPNYGFIDLKAVFYSSTQSTDKSPVIVSSNEYTIQGTTLQTCVLLLFNNCDQLSLETILKETNIPEHCLIKVLQSLILNKPSQCNILMKNPQCQKIELTDKFYINEAFTSESNIVKIHCKNTKFKKILETEINKGNIDQNLNMLIELSIVRIMKSKREMTHSTLIKEVKKVNSNMKSTTAIIKKRIDRLIEKEYIVRSTKDHRVYIYVA